MKKVVILVMLLGALFVLGCDDTRPDNWNVEEGKWEAWGEGVIVSVEKIRGSGCTHDDENKWCSEDYRIELDNGSSFTCGNIRNFGFITVGQKGILYKSARRSNDKYY